MVPEWIELLLLPLFPPGLRARPVDARRWVILSSFLLTLVVAAAFLGLRFLQGGAGVRLWPLALAPVLSSVCYAIWRWLPDRRTLALTVFFGGLAFVIPANTAFGDGLASSTLPAVAIVPISCVYLIGVDAGLHAIWAVLAVLAGIGVAAVSGAFQFPTPSAPPDDELFGIAAAMALSLMSWFVVSVYERERQSTIEALQVSERRYLLALRAEGAGVAEWRPGTPDCFVSPRLAQLLGFREAKDRVHLEAIYGPLAEDDAAVLRSRLGESLRGGGGFRTETTVVLPGLPPRWLAWEGVAEDGTDGDRRVVAIVRDVTEDHRVAQLKDDFVATVSHELRTPLTTIRGAVGLLDAGVGAGLDADGRELVALARRGTERLATLVDDLLDSQRLELGRLPLHLGPTDLGELLYRVAEAHRQMAGERRVSIEVDVPPQANIVIRSDPRRVEQILTNLVNNACKFTRAGTLVHVRARSSLGGVRVEVEDHGPGIPESFRPRLFEKFAQAWGGAARPKGGTGLGLSIARALAIRLGGRIGVESVELAGATFWVELPARLVNTNADEE